MEILIGVGSFLLSLFITVLSVKLAAGWMKAEHSGWGHCLAALLLAYVAAGVVGAGGGFAAGMLAGNAGPEAGIGVAIIVVLLTIAVPIMVFSRILGTSGLRGFAILVIALLVNVAILFGVMFAIVTAMGIGLAGLGSLISMTGMMPGTAGGDREAIERVERGVEQMCACTDQRCIEGIAPGLFDDLMVAMQSGMESGDPGEQARLEALAQRMDECQQIGAPASEPAPEPMPAPEPEPAPTAVPAPEPVAAPAAPPEPASPQVSAPATSAAGGASLGSYAYRDVEVVDAAAHVGQLVRITLADGTRHRDQLIAVEAGSLVLKRGKSEGGGSYPVTMADIVRMEVFTR